MNSFLAVVWNPDTELCRLLGLPIRYYSLMWVIGLVAAYLLVKDLTVDNSSFTTGRTFLLYGKK